MKLMSKYHVISMLALIIFFIAKSAQATDLSSKVIDNRGIIPTIQSIQNINIPQNDIFYHGGPVMGAAEETIPNVYYIWYGNWTRNTAVDLLANFALGLGSTLHYNINSSYFDGRGIRIKRIINFPQSGVFDNNSHGQALTASSILAIVTNAITLRKVPLDANGIYFVLTAPDVNEISGFCTAYCGWHASANILNTNIKYAFVGNPMRCPEACSPQRVSPNNNFAADAMASVISGIIDATVTNPNGNAWHDDAGKENADKCAWQFGNTRVNKNGAKYNMIIAYKRYLIQTNWVNVKNARCLNYH